MNGPRQRAAVDRLEHGGLDLDEAALVEPAAGLRDDPRPGHEALADLRVRDQVPLAVAIASIDVLEAVELVGRRAQALREQHPARDAQGELAGPRLERGALDADDVAEVECEELGVAVAEVVGARLELELAGAVDEVEERGLPHVPPGGEPARHPIRRVRFRTRLEPVVRLADGRDLDAVVELVWKRIDAGLAQAGELLAPLGDDRRLVALGLWLRGLVAHEREPTRRGR